MSIDISSPDAAAEVGMPPGAERAYAIDYRRSLEKAVLDTGLVRPALREIKGGSTYDGKGRTYPDFVVPEAVSRALAENPVYREIYGISAVQILRDESGEPMVNVRFWDDHNHRDGDAINFTIGRGSVGERNHQIHYFPLDRQDEQPSYVFREQNQSNLWDTDVERNRFRKMQPGIKRSLERLRRFPNTFRPSAGERLKSSVGRVISGK